MTSITGEKVSVNQVIEAFKRTGQDMEIQLDHFKAEADVTAARYVFMVESNQGIPELRREEFLSRMERNLANLNIEYKAKRQSQRLKAPVLHTMKPGWYDAQKKRLIASGKRLFQAKTVLLSTKKDLDKKDDWLDGITEFRSST